MIVTPQTRPRAYPTESTADLLGMPLARLRRQIREGNVRAVKIGRRLYVPATEIERLLDVTPIEEHGR